MHASGRGTPGALGVSGGAGLNWQQWQWPPLFGAPGGPPQYGRLCAGGRWLSSRAGGALAKQQHPVSCGRCAACRRGAASCLPIAATGAARPRIRGAPGLFERLGLPGQDAIHDRRASGGPPQLATDSSGCGCHGERQYRLRRRRAAGRRLPTMWLPEPHTSAEPVYCATLLPSRYGRCFGDGREQNTPGCSPSGPIPACLTAGWAATKRESQPTSDTAGTAACGREADVLQWAVRCAAPQLWRTGCWGGVARGQSVPP